MEGLRRDGETEEGNDKGEMAKEGEEKEKTMLDNCPTSEGRASVGRQSPKMPTKAEREEHSITHCPYRGWCPHCVKSRARNAPHRACVEDDPLEGGGNPKNPHGLFLYVP